MGKYFNNKYNLSNILNIEIHLNKYIQIQFKTHFKYKNKLI